MRHLGLSLHVLRAWGPREEGMAKRGGVKRAKHTGRGEEAKQHIPRGGGEGSGG